MPPARPDSAGTRAPDDAPGADPAAILEAEREHLSESIEFLRLMREDVLGLRALGGDPVSEEYLKADLWRRAEALKDIPGTPLFFGRVDYSDATAAARSPASSSTSGGGMSTTRAAGPSWWTGGRRCPGRSTRPARRSRWAWRCAAGSASRAPA
jgi:hypothetical protein